MRRVWVLVCLMPLAGCGFERAERPAWRAQAEDYCLSNGFVKPSQYVQPLAAIDGPGICGMTHPFLVSALKEGAIPLSKPLVMDCPMIPTLEAWLDRQAQPSAVARFGSGIAELEVFGAYSCRNVDNQSFGKLSEHAFGNAVDVSGFKLADGREISIVRDWKRTDTQESVFLHEAQAGACDEFTTVLGPGSDSFHYNHFHLDLANHGATSSGLRRYCRPTPDVAHKLDVARVKSTPQFADAPVDLRGPSGATPPAVEFAPAKSYAPQLPDEDVDASPTSALPPRDD